MDIPKRNKSTGIAIDDPPGPGIMSLPLTKERDVTTLLIAFVLIQPAPAVAEKPRDDGPAFVEVDIIVINQYTSDSYQEGYGWTSRTTWYTSFYDVHYFPSWGMYRMPVLCHRGWMTLGDGSGVPLPANGGWNVIHKTQTLVFSKKMVSIHTFWDFENKMREHWSNPIR
jgi:hypothetical protein